MALTLKVNFTKGWPSATILEKVAAPGPNHVAGGSTPLQAGHVGYLNSNNKWILGIPDVDKDAYVFRGNADDSDAARGSTIPTDYVQVSWGGIQGIAHSNPMEYQTVQFTGTPAYGANLKADTDGKLKAATSGSVIVARVTGTAAPYQGVSMLTVVPVPNRVMA